MGQTVLQRPVASTWLLGTFVEDGKSLRHAPEDFKRSSFQPVGKATSTIKRLYSLWKELDLEVEVCTSKISKARTPGTDLSEQPSDPMARRRLQAAQVRRDHVETALRIELIHTFIKDALVFRHDVPIIQFFEGWQVGYELVYEGPELQDA